jgi:hypothetical protein
MHNTSDEFTAGIENVLAGLLDPLYSCTSQTIGPSSAFGMS